VNDNAYHGTTVACVEISPNKWYGQHSGTPLPPHTHVVSVPDTYRGVYKANDPDAGKKYATEIRDVILKLKVEGKSVAAFFCESIQGCGGQIPLPPNYLQEAYRYVREAGGVCVADEVQVGFGRSGTHFWAFETQGVVPDIVTLGKPIANGYPMGAVVTTPEIAAAFDKKEYFNTFGGNAVACAIALSVLEVIQKEKLQENARVVGDYLTRELKRLQEKHPLIGDVRGLGLFMGIELVRDRKTLEPAPVETKLVVEKMKDYGILTALNGTYENVIRIKPPLCFSKANAQFFVSTLDRVLTELSQQQQQSQQSQQSQQQQQS
jgi:ethanolamine-phosphate phospho-lyase